MYYNYSGDMMSKARLYKINKNENYTNNKNSDIIVFIVGIIVYAVVLLVSSSLFKGIYVENFFFAFIAAFILNILNQTIKPILIYWTLPLTISTYGILYPLSNMIILYLCSLLMGSKFEVNGFVNLFFISIFISGLRILLDNLITNKIGRN